MYGIKCNVRAPHRFMRMGALCWIANWNPGSGGEHVEVLGMTRGGRTVHTWIDSRDLTNFRVGWTSDERRAMSGWTNDDLKTLAARMQELWSSAPIRTHAIQHGSQHV